MMAASMETMLELWAASLRDVKARIRPLFTQARVAASAGLFLDGLLGPERRKAGWMWAEAAGDPGPWRQQAILGRGRWDAAALRDVVRDYALETLADPDAVLVVDETGFLKQGKASCGVGRQYTGSAGKITNCQTGVFAAYVSGAATPLLTVRSICRRPGRATQPAWLRRVGRPRSALPPSPAWPGACAFFAAWCPAGTGIETLVAVEGQRWTIEDSFETAKTEFGLDHNESRSWHGWRRTKTFAGHRHVSLVMLATIRHHSNPAEARSGSRAPAPSQTTQPPTHAHQALFAGRSRKSAALPPVLRNDASGRLTSLPGHSGDARTKPPRNAHM